MRNQKFRRKLQIIFVGLSLQRQIILKYNSLVYFNSNSVIKKRLDANDF
jgi:hypothetical protein